MLVKGFEGYSLTKDGVVTNIKTGQVKTQRKGKNGYKTVNLWQNNTGKLIYMHRLLATEYIPNPENKRTVNHRDGDKLNNDPSNLEWATDSENIQHAYDTGLNKGSTKLITGDVETLYSRFISGESMGEIARDYTFGVPTISGHVNRYVKAQGLEVPFGLAKLEQKNRRAIRNGNTRTKGMSLVMVDKTLLTILNVFSTFKEATTYLNKGSCGPISNVLAGRSKSGYGYYWLRLKEGAAVEDIEELLEKVYELR